MAKSEDQELMEKFHRLISALEASDWQTEYAKARMTTGGKFQLKLQGCLIKYIPDYFEQTFLNDPQKAINEITRLINSRFKGTLLGESNDTPDLQLAITDFPTSKTHYTKISHIRKEHLHKFSFIQGVIKKASPVNMMIESITRQCPDDLTTFTQRYDEQMTPQMIFQCPQCKRKMVNTEINRIPIMFLEIEESSEDANKGSLARMMCIVKGHLTNTETTQNLVIGSPLKIAGWIDVFKKEGEKNIEKPIIRPFGFETTEDDQSHLNITTEEKEKIINLSNKVKYWADNIYTAVYGEQQIKEALIVQMVGNPQSNTQNKITRGDIHQLLIGDAGCVSKDTLVTMANGTQKRIQDIKSGEKIQIDPRNARDKKTGLVINTFKYDKRPVIKIELETGKQLTLTHNHPLWKVGNFRQGEWCEAQNLKIGDRIKTMLKPRLIKIAYEIKDGIKITEDFAKSWGYHVGDGCVTKYKTTFFVNQEEQDIIPKIGHPIQQAFQKEYKIRTRQVKPRFSMGRMINSTKDMTMIDFDSKKMSSFFKNEKGRNKKIPDEILKSKKSVVASFLAGLFEADGTVFPNIIENRTPKTTIALTSTSKRLLQDVQTLLLQFQIQARFHSQNLSIRNQEDVKIFEKEINFVSEKKRKKLQTCLKETRVSRQRRKSIYEKIIKIEKMPNQDVYDIEVKDHHRFIADGIISHNTSKSTLLKLTEKYALKSRYTTGGGSSAVGITASVVKDEISGGWVAEAGAMPLANDGICMIDEIDKMSEDDVKKMHEGMEQQTITIDKGNIHITIPSRTSILGAGNPKNGRFDINDDFYNQIELPIPFLNRIDLIWIMTDEYEEKKDLAIAQKIIDNVTGTNSVKEPTELFKKYLYLTKHHITVLDPAIYNQIVHWYNKTRQAVSKQGTGMRLNPRSIEAILRLTLAHARAELKPVANQEDLNWAKKTFLNSIKYIAIDGVTGEIDMTKLDTGIGYHEKKVIDIIRDMLDANEYLDFETIRAGIDTRVTTREIENLLAKMRQLGEIFSPKPDTYKMIK